MKNRTVFVINFDNKDPESIKALSNIFNTPEPEVSRLSSAEKSIVSEFLKFDMIHLKTVTREVKQKLNKNIDNYELAIFLKSQGFEKIYEANNEFSKLWKKIKV